MDNTIDTIIDNSDSFILIKDKDLIFSCIYLLYKEDTIVYVGQTTQGYSRIYQHLKSKDFDSVKIIKCNTDLLDEEESKLIVKYNPKYNVTLGKYKSLDGIKKYLLNNYGIRVTKIELKRKIADLRIDSKDYNAHTYISCEVFNDVVNYYTSLNK